MPASQSAAAFNPCPHTAEIAAQGQAIADLTGWQERMEIKLDQSIKELRSLVFKLLLTAVAGSLSTVSGLIILILKK
jgi:hypothetical protein